MVRETLAPDRIYAIGDVHGHVDKLRALHAAIRQDLALSSPNTPLMVHLGDYIDRGPDSAACLALLAAETPIAGVTSLCLMGNHERMLLDAVEHPGRAELWLQNGGAATLASWGVDADTPSTEWQTAIPEKHLRFVAGLPMVYQAGRFVFVHAGVRPGIRLEMQAPTDLLWIRDCFLDWDGTMLPDAPDRIIVHGHTPVDHPEVRANRIGIDTNAARGGKLTCAVLRTDSVYFLQV